MSVSRVASLILAALLCALLAAPAVAMLDDPPPPDVTAPAPTLEPAGGRTDWDATAVTLTGIGGTEVDDLDPVVKVYSGPDTTGTLEQTKTAPRDVPSGAYSVTLDALAPGRYTAEATQSDATGNAGTSPPVTFRVDTSAPAPAIDVPSAKQAFKNQNPTFSGTKGNEDGSAAAQSEDDDTLDYEISGGATRSWTDTVDGTTWSAPVPGPELAEGFYTFEVTQGDAAGNSASVERDFKIDLTAPAPTVTGPTGDIRTLRPEITGSAATNDGQGADAVSRDDSTVTVHVEKQGGATSDHVVSVGVGGSWTFTPASDLDVGRYAVTVTQSDAAGNTATSGPQTFRIDASGPAPTIDVPSAKQAFKNQNPTFSGTKGNEDGSAAGQSEDDDTLSYAISGDATRSWTDTATGGSWSTAVPGAPLPEGFYTLEVTQDDNAGNSATVSRTFKIDLTAPAATVTGPSGDIRNPRPAISGSAATNDGQGDNAVGRDDANVTVNVTRQGGTTTNHVVAVTGGGAWTFTPASDLSDGRYSVTVTQGDAAGNSATSSAQLFRLDTSAPAPTIAVPSAKQAFKNQNPTFSGTKGNEDGTAATQSEDDDTLSFAISGDATRAWTDTATGASWSTAVPGAPLLEGFYTLEVTQDDNSGNAATVSRTFKIDLTAPAATVSGPTGDIRNPRPAITGTGATNDGQGNNAIGRDDANVTVNVTRQGGATTNHVVSVGGGGTWTFTPASDLVDGRYSVTVTQGDAAGNTATSSVQSFRLDTSAPAPTIVVPTAKQAFKNQNPTFSGAKGNEDGLAATQSEDDDTLSYAISGDATRSWTATATGTSWSTAVPGAPLAEGFYTLEVTQDDNAGNAATVSRTFKIDLTAPAATVSGPSGDIRNPRPAITGTAATNDGQSNNAIGRDDADVTVNVTKQGGATTNHVVSVGGGGAWTFTPASDLADGRYSVTVTQGDAAGNSATSSAQLFRLDSSAPAPTIDVPSAKQAFKNQNPTFSGTKGNEDGLSATQSEDDDTLSYVISGDATRSWTATATGTAWSTSVPGAPLPEGFYTLEVTQDDNSGNAATVSRTFKIDLTAPTAMVTGPTGDIRNLRPAITGTGATNDGQGNNAIGRDDANVTVNVTRQGGATTNHVVSVGGGGTWTFTPASDLADGRYSVTVTQGDAAGNTATSSAQSFRLDTSAPAPTIVVPSAKQAFKNQNPTFSGTKGNEDGLAATQSEDDDTLSYAISGDATRSWTATTTGSSWSTAVPGAPLPEGFYTLQVTQDDNAGNAATVSRTFKIDLTAPASTVSGPTGDIRNPRPAITGTAATNDGQGNNAIGRDDANVTVDVTRQGGTTTNHVVAVGGGGAWTFTPASDLADGRYSVTVTQGDAAGNSATSSAQLFRLDSSAPAPTIDVPSAKQAFKNQNPTFSGTKANGDGTGATQSEDDDTLSYAISGDATRSWTATATGATWSTAVPGAPLPEGFYTLEVTQDDNAGNAATVSRTFKIDVTAPAPTVTGPSGDIRNARPAITGTAATNDGQGDNAIGRDDANVTVNITRQGGATTNHTVAVSGGGTWTFTPTSDLVDGRYSVTVNQGDAAGNAATSSAQTFRLDTIAPQVTLTEPARYTNNASPHVTGTAGTNTGGVSSNTSADKQQIVISVEDGNGDEVLAPTVRAIGGTGSFDVAIPATFAEGTYEVTVVQLDDAGNTSAPATRLFTVDLTKPQGLALTSPADGAHTKVVRPTFSGTAGNAAASATASADGAVTIEVFDAAGTTLVRSFDGARTGGSFSRALQGADLAEGDYQWRAVQTDAAGNSEATGKRTLRIDTTAPAPTATQPSVSYVGTNQVTISGVRGSADGDLKPVTVQVDGQSLTDSGTNANWSLTTAALADGSYTAIVKQSDRAGNESAVAKAFRVDDTAPSPAIDPVSPAKDTPTITGTAGTAAAGAAQSADGDTIALALTGPDTVNTTTTRTAAAWTKTLGTLTQGRYTVTASQSDGATPANTGSATRQFVIDRTAPTVQLTAPAAGDRNDRSFTVQANVATSDGSGATAADGSTISVRVYAGNGVTTGTPVATANPSRSGGTVSAPISFAGADGRYTIVVEQTDAAGNTGTDTRVIKVDTAAPAPTITTPTEGRHVPTATPQFAGAAGNTADGATASADEQQVRLRIYDNAALTGTPVAVDVNRSGASWSANAPTLAPGTYYAVVRQSDAAGNQGESAIRSFRVDLTAPAPTVAQPSVEYVGTNLVTISGARGTATGDLAPVTVTVGGQTLNDNGTGANWSVTTAALADGSYTAIVKQSDQAGNESAVSKSFKVDDAAPSPAIDPVAPAKDTPTITGTAGTAAAGAAQSADGDTIALALTGPETVNTTTTRSAAAWTKTFGTLAQGRYTVTASQSDGATPANTGSATRQFIIDRTAPAVQVTAPAAGDRNSRSFTVQANVATSDGSGATAADGNTIAVRVYAGNGVTTGTPVASANVARSAGTVSAPISFTGADGRYTIVVEQTDAAGNTGSDVRVVKVDTAAPAPTITSPTEGLHVSTATPHFAGAAGDTADGATTSADGQQVRLRIYDNAALTGTPVAVDVNRTGTAWGADPSALAEGTYYAVARQSDAAGNQGESAVRSFRVDLAGPQPAIVSPADGVHTKDATPTVTVSRSTAQGDLAPLTVNFTRGAQSRTILLAAGETEATPDADLAEGVWTVTVSQSDQSGRTGTASRTIRIDLTAPALGLTTVCNPCKTLSSLTGARGTATGDLGKVTVTGIGPALEDNGSGATWTVSPNVADGVYTVAVKQSDQAGNQTTVNRTFTIDGAAPAPAVTGPSGDIKDKRPAIAGTATTNGVSADDANVTVHLDRGGTTTNHQVPVTGGAWTFTPASDLPDGRYSVTVSQGDAAGNTGTSAARAFRVDTVDPVVSLDAVPSPGNDSTPTFTGTKSTADGTGIPSAIGPVTVTVHQGGDASGTIVRTVTTTTSGVNGYTGTFVTGLPDGTFTAVAKQTDGAGNTGASSPRTFAIDTAAPQLSMTAPADAAFTKASPTLTGASDDPAKVTVVLTKSGSAPVVLEDTTPSPDWSVNASGLAEGTWNVTVDQVDLAGNAAGTITRTIRVDTTAPAVAVGAPAARTGDATPDISGTAGSGPGDAGTVSVTVVRVGSGQTVATRTPAVSGGAWSLTAPELADGAYEVQVSQEDAAGNASTVATRQFTVDTTAPEVALTAPSDGTFTNDTTPTVTIARGAAAGDLAPVTVTFSRAGQTDRVVTLADGDTQATPAALSEGAWTVAAHQVDDLGNAKTTAARTLRVDLTAPEVAVTAPAAGAELSDTTPTLTGTAGNAPGDGGNVTATLKRNGAPDVVVSAPVAGTAWSADAPALTPGTYELTVKQADAAGNERVTASRTFIVDPVGPDVTLASPVNDTETTDTTPTLAGAAGVANGDKPAVRVKLYAGPAATGEPVQSVAATAAGGAWTVDVDTPLAVGVYTARAEQDDNAGNTGQSAPRSFAIVAPPVPPVVTPEPTATPPAPPPPAGTGFEIGRIAAGTDGSATFQITAAEAGTLTAAAKASVPAGRASAAAKTKSVLVAGGHLFVKGAGPVKLKLKPNRTGLELLRRKGKLKATVRMTFQPLNLANRAQTSTKTVVLKLKR